MGIDEEALCKVIESLYLYGIAKKVKDKILIDIDAVLAACKRVLDYDKCKKSLKYLEEELIAKKVLVAELFDRIIIGLSYSDLYSKIQKYIETYSKNKKGVQRMNKLIKIDDILGIRRRERWHYMVDEKELFEYWLTRGIRCGVDFMPQTPKQACLMIAGLLINDDISWSAFQRIIANAIYLGLENHYNSYVEYPIDDESIDILLIRRQNTTSYPYEIVVIEVKSRSKHKLLTRSGEQDPLAQLKRYIRKIVEAYPSYKNVLGILITNGFASRRLLTDFISEAQAFQNEISRYGKTIRLELLDFLALHEVLEKCVKERYAKPPALLLLDLLSRKASMAKNLLNNYNPPRTSEEALVIYRMYQDRIMRYIREALDLRQ